MSLHDEPPRARRYACAECREQCYGTLVINNRVLCAWCFHKALDPKPEKPNGGRSCPTS